jgi:hypothetical protein
MPEDVVTPVVICPTCGKLIAVREEPRPLTIPERTEQSDAITPTRPPDQHDVMSRPTSYRSPIEPQRGPLTPLQRVQQALVPIVGCLLPGASLLIGAAPFALWNQPITQAIFGYLVFLFLVLSGVILAVWRVAGVVQEEKAGRSLAGFVAFLGTLIIGILAGMCLLLTVCNGG